jgi:hypothetical protein
VHDICALLGYYAALSVVVLYRRFGTTYRSHLPGSSWNSWPLNMGLIGYTETWIHKYYSALRKYPRRPEISILFDFNTVTK